MVSESMSVTKAVIPVAGLGTRFLPATKAQPKEMLPVVDTPAIQYVVEEAAHAGLTDILLVTSRGKSSIEDHFDRAPVLEAALEAKGDDDRLRLVRESAQIATISSVRQSSALGLGHAVLCAREHIGNETFAVMLGDDLIDPRDAILANMLAVAADRGGSVLCLMEVPADRVHLYGCAAVEATDDPDVVVVTGLVEKPHPGTEPSNYIVIGRYVVNPAVFAVLDRTGPGRGGEIQLTDALAELTETPVNRGGGVHGVIFTGRRYDTGDKLSYLQASVQLACERGDLGPDLRAWLAAYVESDTFKGL